MAPLDLGTGMLLEVEKKRERGGTSPLGMLDTVRHVFDIHVHAISATFFSWILCWYFEDCDSSLTLVRRRRKEIGP